jgi:uncharacterized protein (TIGR02300 family)
MPELKLGNKFECFNCGSKFYDLGKPEAICPKCGADQKNAHQAESPASSQASRKRRKAEVVKPPVEVEEEETIEVAPDDELEAPEPDDTEVEEEEDIEDEE